MASVWSAVTTIAGRTSAGVLPTGMPKSTVKTSPERTANRSARTLYPRPIRVRGRPSSQIRTHLPLPLSAKQLLQRSVERDPLPVGDGLQLIPGIFRHLDGSQCCHTSKVTGRVAEGEGVECCSFPGGAGESDHRYASVRLVVDLDGMDEYQRERRQDVSVKDNRADVTEADA